MEHQPALPADTRHYYRVSIPYPGIPCQVCGTVVALPTTHIEWHKEQEKNQHDATKKDH